jgi:hypothetical protein
VLFRTASGSRPEIISVQLDQVEARHAVVAAADRFAVDDACSRPAHSPHRRPSLRPTARYKGECRWRRNRPGRSRNWLKIEESGLQGAVRREAEEDWVKEK